MTFPRVHLTDETMREGMQIESANIPLSAKIELLNKLSETGVKNIVVGSFVSPKYTPQMAQIDDLIAAFEPKSGVRYTALALNEKGRERLRQYMPPLQTPEPVPALVVEMSDTFARRNTNRTQAEQLEACAEKARLAAEAGMKWGQIGLGSAWGSNFDGGYTIHDRMQMLERLHDMWSQHGVSVSGILLADPMSWCMPHNVADQVSALIGRWPDVTDYRLHLHDARGMAVASVYAAIRALDERHDLHIDATLGGIGGCPYCGNGRATGMAPIEDLAVMLEEMGIHTGIDIVKLIETVWHLEQVLGRPTAGHVSKTGPLPRDIDELYDPNLPFVETFDEAKHFLLGPKVCENGIRPWKTPIPDVRSQGSVISTASSTST